MDQSEDFQAGSIEVKVRSDVASLVTEHPMGESLAETAFNLARKLDGESRLSPATAGAAKELRETLVALASMGVDGDDLGDALSVPTSFRDSPES